MGSPSLKSKRKDEKIFLSCPRLSYVSPQGINQPLPDPAVPRAYLKYIHYDQDSQFVSMGHMPISDEANEGYQQLLLQLVAQEDGFVQFFVANETLRDVYFDDITGMVRRPKIIQEGHYNPFGLPLAGLTTLGNPEYAYFFTGKELYEDEALMWYDYGARMYDVQIGRWTTHDPLYQDASPYVYCANNGINYLDPDGRAWGWLDMGLSVLTGGAWAVGKLAYEFTIKGSQFDSWLAKNEKTLINIGFTAVGIGLSFTGVGLIGTLAIAGTMGALQAGYNSNWDPGAMALGAGMGILGGLAGAGASRAFAGAFLDMGVRAGMALQGAAAGAVSGTFMGFAGGVVQNLAAGKEGWDVFQDVGWSMLKGAGIGAGMGGAMGFAASFQKTAASQWESRRIIRDARIEASRLGDGKVQFENRQQLDAYLSATDEQGNLMRPNLKKMVDHFNFSEIQMGNLPDGVVGTNKYDVDPVDLFPTNKITLSTSRYSANTYFKGMTHEYVHSFHHVYYDPNIRRSDWQREKFINWNFNRLRSFQFN